MKAKEAIVCYRIVKDLSRAELSEPKVYLGVMKQQLMGTSEQLGKFRRERWENVLEEPLVVPVQIESWQSNGESYCMSGRIMGDMPQGDLRSQFQDDPGMAHWRDGEPVYIVYYPWEVRGTIGMLTDTAIETDRGFGVQVDVKVEADLSLKYLLAQTEWKLLPDACSSVTDQVAAEYAMVQRGMLEDELLNSRIVSVLLADKIAEVFEDYTRLADICGELLTYFTQSGALWIEDALKLSQVVQLYNAQGNTTAELDVIEELMINSLYGELLDLLIEA